MSDFFTAVGSVLGVLFTWQLWGVPVGFYFIGIALIALILSFIKGKKS